jgi:hypothetical protein
VGTDCFGIDVVPGAPEENDEKYDQGVAFGMLVSTVMSGAMLLYCIGVKGAFSIAEILDVISFTRSFTQGIGGRSSV